MKQILFLALVSLFFTHTALAVSPLPIDIISETNAWRELSNLPDVKVSDCLTLEAQLRLNDMIQNQYFSHVSLSGKHFWDFAKLAKVGYGYGTLPGGLGENLARTFLTAQDTLIAWMNSPTHRATLLTKGYNEIGVATGTFIFQGKEQTLIVEEFGARYKGMKSCK